MNEHSSQAPTLSTSKAFGEFPLAIRIAQRSLLLAILIPILLRTMLKARVPWLRVGVGIASAACAVVGLVATYYAVIRYPYMGLVDAADGDLFSQYIEARPKWLLNLAKIVGVIVAIAAIVLPAADGQINGNEFLLMFYALSVLGFLIFLLFFYERVDHPTIATFLRCSMGLGIFFYPLFIPALIFGSMRVKVLLDEASHRIEAEKRRS